MKESEARNKFCPYARTSATQRTKCMALECVMWEPEYRVEWIHNKEGSERPDGDGWIYKSKRQIRAAGQENVVAWVSSWWRSVQTDSGDCGLKSKGQYQ